MSTNVPKSQLTNKKMTFINLFSRNVNIHDSYLEKVKKKKEYIEVKYKSSISLVVFYFMFHYIQLIIYLFFIYLFNN